jgi:hypothetical protein
VQRPLPEAKTQPAIKPISVVLHSDAGGPSKVVVALRSIFGWFLNHSNLESHFWIAKTGLTEQFMPVNVRADANRFANRFKKWGIYVGAVSIETESSKNATEPWTPEQVTAIVDLLVWLRDEWGIPMRRMAVWDDEGVCWHIEFGSPGPMTPVAKACPGAARIRQVPGIIDAAARAGAANPNDPPAYPGFPLRTGANNKNVAVAKVMLRYLNYQRFDTSPKGINKFTLGFYWAVRRFQKNNGLKVDGVFGRDTWEKARQRVIAVRAQG